MKNAFYYIASSLGQKSLAKLVFIFSCVLVLNQLKNYFYPEVPVQILSSSSQVDLKKIVFQYNAAVFSFPLFGKYLSQDVEQADVKQSMLDMKVVGILLAEKREESQVIIHSSAGDEKIYLLGDSLPGNILIKKIDKKGIIVLHNGLLERLSLPKSTLAFESLTEPLLSENI